MKTKLTLCLLLSILTINIFSQEIPKITVGKKTITVQKLQVDVSIVGDIAITTFDMQFYNPTHRILEGTFSFPLGENQSVVRFALDINGNLREAVIVEKEKARVAFESTVRQRIDPALLEKTKGNTYKARIYPIPAKGYKRVVIAYQQKLLVNKNAYYYKLPFSFKKKLKEYSFSMQVFNQKNKPIIKKGMLKAFFYDAQKDVFITKIAKKSVKIAQPILIRIPLDVTKEKLIASDDYFYATKQLTIPKRNRIFSKEITFLWDNSLSQKTKKLATELALLDTYFKKNKSVTVNLVVFNIDIQYKKKYQIVNGNWKKLKKELQKITYDGASSFNFLDTYVDKASTHFLFSDGLNTLSNLNFQCKKRTYIINSNVAANHIILKDIATKSGGSYINLQQVSIKNAFDKIRSMPLQILGTNLAEDVAFYPKRGSTITTNFYLVGKGKFTAKKLKIYIGFGNDTLQTISFSKKRKRYMTNLVSKIWAQQKMNFLQVKQKENRAKMVKLSEKYQILSPFTSLLILDRVEDYVTHSIEPPKELKEKYDELIVLKANNKKERLQRLQNGLFDKFDALFTWYNTTHKQLTKHIIKQNKNTVSTPVVIVTNQQKDTLVPDTLVRENEFFISGIIKDVNGTMPDVSIQIKGITRGTESDFDGKYTLKVARGDILQFNYLGYESVEKTVMNSGNIDIELQEGGENLDEIVVTALGVRRERRSVSYSVSSISSESISTALSGKVAGVQITVNTGTNIRLRGASSITKNSQPMFVVDGEIVKNVSNIKQENIHSLYVLNATQGQQIYGSKAKNGIIVYITKNGFDDELDAIDDFEDLVKEKIELKGWNPKTPYLKKLKKEKNRSNAYQKYLQLRSKYHKSPSFYIDVADYFNTIGAKKIATRILTNVAEIDLDNYELLRALAYKFEAYNLWEYAVHTYTEILELRPEDIQSYRDLALAYEQIGAYQKSVDLLYKIVNGELLEKDENRRYSGVEEIALGELNRMLLKYNEKINKNYIDTRFIRDTSVDIKVVIDWNHNDTDIDLWVIDPKGEKCYYGHKKTKLGGLLSDDMTEGFGPEQFLLKKAIKGNYQLKIKYYASNQQKISGPTFLKITTFKNYGKINEVKTSQLVRLKNVDEVLDMGNLVY